jgi:hypothetical protein
MKKIFKKQLIVLSIPHELCHDINQDCDLYAKKMADELIFSLSTKSREIVTIHGDINRTIVDLNRYEGRFTDFRQSVREVILNQVKFLIKNIKSDEISENKIVYLIDCHSFVPGDHKYGNVRIKNPDVCIIFNKCSLIEIIEELTDLLKENNLITTKLYGVVDDIVDETTGYNDKFNLSRFNIKIVPILVEVNESIDEKKIPRIAKAINQWIININKYLLNPSFFHQLEFFQN